MDDIFIPDYMPTDPPWDLPSGPPLHVSGNVIGNTNVNIALEGFIAASGDRLYFGNVRSNHARLYTMNLDGSDKHRLSGDDVRYVNVYGDRIFYVNRSITESIPCCPTARTCKGCLRQT
jgi:hypothetical protein